MAHPVVVKHASLDPVAAFGLAPSQEVANVLHSPHQVTCAARLFLSGPLRDNWGTQVGAGHASLSCSVTVAP